MWTFEYTDANSQTQAGSPCGAASFKTPWDAQKELTRKLWEPTTDPDESGNLDGKILCNYHNYIYIIIYYFLLILYIIGYTIIWKEREDTMCLTLNQTEEALNPVLEEEEALLVQYASWPANQTQDREDGDQVFEKYKRRNMLYFYLGT